MKICLTLGFWFLVACAVLAGLRPTPTTQPQEATSPLASAPIYFSPPAPASASATATTTRSGNPADLAQGRFYLVKGEVKKLLHGTSEWRPTGRGALFQPSDSIRTGMDGNTVIVLANGAVVWLRPNTELRLKIFRQAPFDQVLLGTFLRLQSDPSKSDVRLELGAGTIGIEVKNMNVAAGSSFLVETPAGNIAVTGNSPRSIFSVTLGNAAGSVSAGPTLQASFFAGTVTYTSVAGHAPQSIAAGSILSANLRNGSTGFSFEATVSENAIAAPQPFLLSFEAMMNETIQAYNSAHPGSAIPFYATPPRPVPPAGTRTLSPATSTVTPTPATVSGSPPQSTSPPQPGEPAPSGR